MGGRIKIIEKEIIIGKNKREFYKYNNKLSTFKTSLKFGYNISMIFHSEIEVTKLFFF